MPLNGLLVERANAVFNREAIQRVAADALLPRGFNRTVLSTAATSLGIAQNDAEREALNQWPVVLQEVIRGALQGAVLASSAAENYESILPATLAWVPAYDYTVSVSQAHSAIGSAGGITILLGSPYPRAAAR
jgi:hypothetical protein